jgi:hypothetical protein
MPPVYQIAEAGRRARAAAPPEGILPPAPELARAFLCHCCTDATCDYCTWLRSWGARSVCVRCGAPLEQPPRVFVDRRPVCGECA